MSTLLEEMAELDIAVLRLTFAFELLDCECFVGTTPQSCRPGPNAENDSVIPSAGTEVNSTKGTERISIPIGKGNLPFDCFQDATDVPQPVPIRRRPVIRFLYE